VGVISIKKFLNSDNENERALTHALRTLIQGISDHTITGAPGDAGRFRESIQKLNESLGGDITHEELLVQAGSIVKALEDHNHRVARQHAQHSAELQNMVGMLTSALAEVSSGGEANATRLTEIEKRLASTWELEDMRSIKVRLGDCIASIRSEVERQRKSTQKTIEQLNQSLEQARQCSTVATVDASQDPVTGLPIRAGAETSLAEAGQSPTPVFVAVMVLDRLQGLNARFGREVGDEVLRTFTKLIRRGLRQTDQVFRWSGPVLIAVLPRTGAIDRARSDIARIFETKTDHTIETGSRSILIPIAPRWAVFPMAASARLMSQRIDTFSNVPSGRDQ
jgi:diguanylate cyclase (GGDEF)-like protein